VYAGAGDVELPVDQARLLERILEYNEDDCRAMAHIVGCLRVKARWPGDGTRM
jgi:predicted RecB family nuclease